jgi:DNA-binding SARP family transcriptional activator/tetratricopeptide (TPR) repeat protein
VTDPSPPLVTPIYRILGPLEVSNGPEREFKVPHGRQQIVLGVLLCEANRVVSIDHLIDAIWPGDPPPTARTQVQICVSWLRRELAQIGCNEAIITRVPGYVLQVANGQLDSQVLAQLTAKAARLARDGELGEAAEALRQALALWRGPALSGVGSELLAAKGTQLDETRLTTLESYLDLELTLGRHHQVVIEVKPLVTQHPLRERLRGLLMLALYRADRQAEALEVYRVGRELLIDELGLEPGENLRRLEAAILADDPALRLGPDATPAAVAVRAPIRNGGALVPFQLPADISDFTGRITWISEAERLLAGAAGQRATQVIVLVGKPGVGKSALAVHIAHRLAETHFPDGQLYSDLGETRAHPATASDVLGRFLRALDIPGSSVPDPLEERAEMYRQCLARKRMLIVLDHAHSEDQVRPLLPGANTCAVIVTSRARLTGLPGARVLEIEVFEPDQAVEMLSAVIGAERVAAEPAAAQALIRLVGGLPLALRIVAARLAARERWSLAWMLERLSDERRRLDELAHGGLMVRASIALTHDSLAPDTRRLLRLLGMLDGLSFPTWVAAALLDADLFSAADLLELLVDAQMLEIAAVDINGSPRYKLHDLIRIFAREQLDRHEAEPQRVAAVRRVVGGWLALAGEAHSRVYGGDFTVLHGTAPRWNPPRSYADRLLADPLMWLEAEHATLCSAITLAAENGLDEACWDLAVTAVTLFEARCYFSDWERTHQQALAVTEAAGNRRGSAAVMCSLASLRLSSSRPWAAERLVRPTLETFLSIRDVHGTAMARRNLALLLLGAGDTQAALAEFSAALEEFRQAGDPIGRAHVLAQIARIEMNNGNEEAAAGRLHMALDICREFGNQRVERQVRFRLSELMIRQGRLHEADAILADLLVAVRASGDLVGEAQILRRSGLVKSGLGELAAAEERLRAALSVWERAMDHGCSAETRLELALVLAARGGQAEAAGLLGQAITTFTERNMTASRQRAEQALADLALADAEGWRWLWTSLTCWMSGRSTTGWSTANWAARNSSCGAWTGSPSGTRGWARCSRSTRPRLSRLAHPTGGTPTARTWGRWTASRYWSRTISIRPGCRARPARGCWHATVRRKATRTSSRGYGPAAPSSWARRTSANGPTSGRPTRPRAGRAWAGRPITRTGRGTARGVPPPDPRWRWRRA